MKMSETLSDETEVYEPTHRSTVNRYKTRATYDHKTVHGIIDSSPVLHVAFNPTSLSDDPFPTILPMIGCTGAYAEPSSTSSGEETPATCIYIHGHVSSRLMKLPDPNRSGKEIEEFDGLPGTPVCISATHMDGLVLALAAFNHSCNYRSAVVHGYATIVTSPAEKLYALERITNFLIPDRWANTRVPPTSTEMSTTTVLKVEIASASAKVRAGVPGNDKADLDLDKEGVKEMRERVWTGVVPSWVVWGEPVPAEENLVNKVPEYIADWVKEKNETGEAYAAEVAGRRGVEKKD